MYLYKTWFDSPSWEYQAIIKCLTSVYFSLLKINEEKPIREYNVVREK